MLLRRTSSDGGDDWQGWMWNILRFSWIASILSGIWVDTPRLDFVLWLVIAPLSWTLFFFPSAWIYARANRWSLRQTVETWMPWILFLAFAIPCLTWIGEWMGFVWLIKDNLTLRELPLAWFTLGWLPHPIASFGVTVALSISAIVAGWRAAHTGHHLLRGFSVFTSLIVFWGFLFVIPSMMAWLGRPTGVSLSSLSPAEVFRSAILLSMDGYWWQNIHARFLGGVGGETEMSAKLLEGALVFLGVAWMACRWIWKKRKEHFIGTSSFSFLRPFFFLFWGAAFAYLQGARPDARFVSIIAWLTALTTACLFAVALSLRRKGHDASVWFFVLCLAGAWLLGWPIFLLTATALALTSMEIGDSAFWKWKSWMASASAGCLAVIATSVSWLFMMRQADLSRFPIAFVLAILVGVSGFHAAQTMRRWSPAMGGYLVAGLLLGSRTSFLFSMLVALATWFAWRRQPSREWEKSLWFYLFFAIALVFERSV